VASSPQHSPANACSVPEAVPKVESGVSENRRLLWQLTLYDDQQNYQDMQALPQKWRQLHLDIGLLWQPSMRPTGRSEKDL